LNETIRNNKSRLEMPGSFHKRFSIIKKVLQQQTIRFQGGEVKGLIVSINKQKSFGYFLESTQPMP